MSKYPRSFLLSVLIGLAAQAQAQAPSKAPSKAPAKAAERVRFRGYSIDVRNLAGKPNRDTVLASVKDQLTLADTVRLDSAKKAFMRSIPIVILTETTGSMRYTDSTVFVPAHAYDKERPQLLHELMHAYHNYRLRDGFGNAAILSMYEQARTGGKFPADAYMLSNVGEYFGMMAAVFLHGSALRDPFTRDSIRLKQPDMYAWLVREFGRRR